MTNRWFSRQNSNQKVSDTLMSVWWNRYVVVLCYYRTIVYIRRRYTSNSLFTCIYGVTASLLKSPVICKEFLEVQSLKFYYVELQLRDKARKGPFRARLLLVMRHSEEFRTMKRSHINSYTGSRNYVVVIIIKALAPLRKIGHWPRRHPFGQRMLRFGIYEFLQLEDCTSM